MSLSSLEMSDPLHVLIIGAGITGLLIAQGLKAVIPLKAPTLREITYAEICLGWY